MVIMKKYKQIYDYSIIILAVISITFVILDYTSVISLTSSPFFIIDNTILIIFAIDYFGRFFLAKNKWIFFKTNIFDLIAIIPLNSFFSIFRVARIFRIARAARMVKMFRFVRLIGVTGKAQKNIKKFFQTNGLSYVLGVSGSLIVICALIYSNSESVPFSTAIWWAITTASTVGYGDVSPQTTIGKATAILLMVVGVGVIGSLTSTITSFFMNSDDSNNDELKEEIKQLNKKIDHLTEEIEKTNKKY